VFASRNSKRFEACFIRWMNHLCPALADRVVAIDGKTVRGSHRTGERAIHLVSAYGCGRGVVLGQLRTADKSNEITAIPELLDALLLKRALVTIDAMRVVVEWQIAARGGAPSLKRMSYGFRHAGSDQPEDVAWIETNSKDIHGP
jgi:Transposase DDE domain